MTWPRIETRRDSTTFFSGLWPQGGEPGDVLYYTVGPTRGWEALERGQGKARSRLRPCYLGEAHDALGDAALLAHGRALAGATRQAELWTDRRARLFRERRRVTGNNVPNPVD